MMHQCESIHCPLSLFPWTPFVNRRRRHFMHCTGVYTALPIASIKKLTLAPWHYALQLNTDTRLKRCTVWSTLKLQRCSSEHIMGDDVSTATKGTTNATMVSMVNVTIMWSNSDLSSHFCKNVLQLWPQVTMLQWGCWKHRGVQARWAWVRGPAGQCHWSSKNLVLTHEVRSPEVVYASSQTSLWAAVPGHQPWVVKFVTVEAQWHASPWGAVHVFQRHGQTNLKCDKPTGFQQAQGQRMGKGEYNIHPPLQIVMKFGRGRWSSQGQFFNFNIP
jgi:hypothetical protein